MTDKCKTRDTDEVGWVCYLPDGHDGPHRPTLSDDAKEFILDNEWLPDALFDLGLVFNIPLTNNGIPWLDKDTGDPVYDVGEFIDMMQMVIDKFRPKEK